MLAAVLLVAPGHARASATDLASAFDQAGAFEPMDDTEMAARRGGFRGIAFGIEFLGGAATAPTAALPDGVSVDVLSDNRVQIQAGLGDLAGASGIFQFVNVVGDMNVVNNSVVINVMVVPDVSGLPGF